MNSEKGFSLIEMVAAVAIAGTALAVLMQVIGANVNRAALTSRFTEATALAESILTRTGTDLPLVVGVDEGRFDRVYAWRRATQVFHEDPLHDVETELPLVPYEVAVTVWWRDSGQRKQVTLRTLRLKKHEQYASAQ